MPEKLPANDPKEPLAVCHAGASATVNIALPDLTAFPSGFSTLTKYVPSTDCVKLATIVEALVKDTEVACSIAPVSDFCISTNGVVTKLPPLIVILVASLVITLGLIPEIVGPCATAAFQVPSPLKK